MGWSENCSDAWSGQHVHKETSKLDMNFGGVADLFDQTLYYIQCQNPHKKIVKVPQKTDQTHKKL